MTQWTPSDIGVFAGSTFETRDEKARRMTDPTPAEISPREIIADANSDLGLTFKYTAADQIIRALSDAGYVISKRAFPNLMPQDGDHYVAIPSAFLRSDGKAMLKDTGS